MRNPVCKFIAFGSLALVAHTALAMDPTARILNLINPPQSIGIRIGDVMERKVMLEVSAPYQISRSALPMKGANRNGIELADIQVKTAQQGRKTIHEIALRYQVFASASAPIVMQLPEEAFALTGGPQAMSVKLPGWRFWFSPLVTADINSAKESLQPQYKLALIDPSAHQYRLALFLGLFAAGLAGIIYINADRRWLPFMGGAFAQAHRHLKKLPRHPAQEKKALLHLHQAFNQVFGANLFARDIGQFLAAHPEFAKLKPDIESFFEQSNKSLFAQQLHDSAQFINDLIAFSKSMRDCERGVA